MIKKINAYIYIVCFFLILFFFIYKNYNKVILEESCSYNYYNLLFFLKKNDINSANFYAKRIIDRCGNTFYYDFALVFKANHLKKNGKDRKYNDFYNIYLKKKIKMFNYEYNVEFYDKIIF